ncbi:MAG: FHA domain-containing protein [Bacteroidales bacterium]|nr:FHA domain-containing protein [Bacteroidales bacterium]
MKTYKIGRDTDNDIVINDQDVRVSRYHATLTIHDNGTITINDQSTNGTYVNGVKIKSQIETAVSTSDSIVLAKTTQLDWNLISTATILKPMYIASESQKPVYSATPQKAKNTSIMQTIGWILIVIGIIGIYRTGLSFTF